MNAADIVTIVNIIMGTNSCLVLDELIGSSSNSDLYKNTMLKLENIGMALENIRPIFFDFGLIYGNTGMVSDETDFYALPHAYTYVRTYIDIYKNEVNPPTPTAPNLGVVGVGGAASFLLNTITRV